MKKLISILFVNIFMYGCVTLEPTVPEDYSGPIATIKDSAKSIDLGKADLFYLSHIDGKQIRSSRSASLNASYGRGNYLEIVIINNSVQTKKQTFTIVGQTEYAMPIRGLTGKVYKVKGDVVFSPVADEAYAIKGELSDKNSSVWIERISDGEIIKKIEK